MRPELAAGSAALSPGRSRARSSPASSVERMVKIWQTGSRERRGRAMAPTSPPDRPDPALQMPNQPERRPSGPAHAGSSAREPNDPAQPRPAEQTRAVHAPSIFGGFEPALIRVGCGGSKILVRLADLRSSRRQRPTSAPGARATSAPGAGCGSAQHDAPVVEVERHFRQVLAVGVPVREVGAGAVLGRDEAQA